MDKYKSHKSSRLENDSKELGNDGFSDDKFVCRKCRKISKLQSYREQFHSNFSNLAKTQETQMTTESCGNSPHNGASIKPRSTIPPTHIIHSLLMFYRHRFHNDNLDSIQSPIIKTDLV